MKSNLESATNSSVEFFWDCSTAMNLDELYD